MNIPIDEQDIYPREERVSAFSGFSFTEMAYFFVMFYSVLGAPLGLTVGNIGVGILMLFVLAVWFAEAGGSLASVVSQISLALACGVSYVLIQTIIHNESSTQMYVRNYGIWIPSLIVVQWLVGREQFLHRFAFVTIALGFAMIPYMNISSGSAYQRFALDSDVGFGNPNDLGCWYGFCALYLALAGFSARTTTTRMFYWIGGLVCLYLITLTISRSPLIAMAASLFVALRRLYKESFPLMILLGGLIYGAMALGVFDVALKSYSIRATEETGRLGIWPILIEKFLSFPLLGVGVSHSGAIGPRGDYITAHNGFLLIGVSSGILPLLLFIGQWAKAAIAALRAYGANWPGSEFQLPLLVYAFLVTNTGNQSFMAPWAIVCLALPLWPHPPGESVIEQRSEAATYFPQDHRFLVEDSRNV